MYWERHGDLRIVDDACGRLRDRERWVWHDVALEARVLESLVAKDIACSPENSREAAETLGSPSDAVLQRRAFTLPITFAVYIQSVQLQSRTAYNTRVYTTDVALFSVFFCFFAVLVATTCSFHADWISLSIWIYITPVWKFYRYRQITSQFHH